MKLRDHSKLLVILSYTLLCHVYPMALGGVPAGCPTQVELFERRLIDSCCCDPLISSTNWVAVDSDGDGETWTASFQSDNCLQSVMICNSTDDWLATTYINSTLESGVMATELPVDIACTGDCSSLELWAYQTNDATLNRSAVDFASVYTMVGPVSSTVTVSELTMRGLYLAVRAQNNACATINQLSVIVDVCDEETLNSVTFPTSYSSNDSVAGSCIDNSEPFGPPTAIPTATCGSRGVWSPTSSCVCSAGHTLETGTCVGCAVGTFKGESGNEACTSCPINSQAVVTGSTICNCEANHTRPTPTVARDGCTECIENFFLVGSRCMMCPMSSTSSGGNATDCTCVPNHTTVGGSTTTTGDSCVCQANYHVNGAGQCVTCPVNSQRAINDNSSSCTCTGNYRTQDGRTTISGTDGCTGCADGYFLQNSMCVMCPGNSASTDPTSTSCICNGGTVTDGDSTTATDDTCSYCPANYKRTSTTGPLTCGPCQDRSQRQFDDPIDTCTCLDGYEKREQGSSDECQVRVIIPTSPLRLKEGSATMPSSFAVNLTGASYNGLNVLINVESAYRDKVIPNTNIVFVDGTRQATVEIDGNDEALDSEITFDIEVQANDAYVGSGAISVIIEDDDAVGVGFVASQPVVFNESDGMVDIMLNKNASTAQNILVNILLPEDSPISVSNPVTLPKGLPGNVPVSLMITDDTRGGEADEMIMLSLELVSPMEFSHLIDLDVAGDGVSDQLIIIVKDNDPAPQGEVLSLYAIIGIAVGGAAVMVLLILIVLVCICICRINANRQGFYFTDEDKTTAPPSMLRYSASLRSISSQSVVPIVGGKGQAAEKENEFYV